MPLARKHAMQRRPTPRASRSRATALLLALLTAAVVAGCGKAERGPTLAAEPSPVAAAAPPAPPPGAADQSPGARPGGGQAPTLAAAAEAGQRRVIRNADLTLEVESGAGAQQRAAAIAEAAGGFIVSSDAQNMSAGGKPYVHATVVARVPAGRFEPTLDQMRKVGKRVVGEKVTGQDVTEEFVDLEARLRVQRALEDQLLGLLKESKTVKDTLEVHRELAQVRTEIERVEGRRRFLVNQTDLATITLRLQEPTPFISSSGGPSFGARLGRALGDAVEAAQEVVLFFVRALGVLLPLGVLIALPIALLVRRLVRKQRAQQQQQALRAAARPLGAGPA